MDIKRAGSQPSGQGPADYFTGTVWQDPIITPQAPMQDAAYTCFQQYG